MRPPGQKDDGTNQPQGPRQWDEGKTITGGQLFHRYLLNRSWVAKEVTVAATATKGLEGEALKATNEMR